jgi:hypothetical protein
MKNKIMGILLIFISVSTLCLSNTVTYDMVEDGIKTEKDYQQSLLIECEKNNAQECQMYGQELLHDSKSYGLSFLKRACKIDKKMCWTSSRIIINGLGHSKFNLLSEELKILVSKLVYSGCDRGSFESCREYDKIPIKYKLGA